MLTHGSRQPRSWLIYNVRHMKTILGALLTLVITVYVAGEPADFPITERKAEGIVRALPEFVKLVQDHRADPEDLVIDGPILSTAGAKSPAKIGKQYWGIDVYQIVHDGPAATDPSHGALWACFLVNAYSGEIFVCEPDWSSRR